MICPALHRRYRQSQRSKRMMAETAKARAFTRWISQMQTQRMPEKVPTSSQPAFMPSPFAYEKAS
eukprot:scaffold8903_cov38-Prasinocladus_malaysianus.AAC.1